MQQNDFDGFMPSLHDVELTEKTSMITTEGDLIDGHIIKLSLGDDTQVICSATVDQLQKLFFLLLKTLG
jgi:hypothetical protein